MKRPRPLAALVVAVCLTVALAFSAALGVTTDDRAVGGATAAGSGPGPRGLPHHSAALVADARTGRVLWSSKPHRRLLVASTTKLMTALVTLERARLDESFAATDYAGDREESLMWLVPGERLTVADLLRGLLLASGNDAAMALAVGVAGSEEAFVELMNERARELGLDDTRYGNPIGLDDGTWSSAADLVALTRELRRHDFFRETVAAPELELTSGARPRMVVNSNRLLGRMGVVDGVKTGHTGRAGYVLVGSATRGGVTVISAVLGARDEDERDAATLALLRYGLREAAR